MIYVTQGHEKSISIEIFIKSFLSLTYQQQKLITLICNKNSLITNLELMNLDYEISSYSIKILNSKLKCLFVFDSSLQTTTCLNEALKILSPKDILLTLPSSKDQIFYNHIPCKGHTDFFSKVFKKEMSMTFSFENHHILLITDHIPLNKVSTSITAEIIIQKINNILKETYYQEIIFSGINPHAGENGLLGTEESNIVEAINKLEKLYNNTFFLGPYAGDSILNNKNSKKQLFVYMNHDQGLSAFKSLYGLNGIQRTYGMPFIRVSVDHGTAFKLFGKNKAHFTGALYSLKWSLNYLTKKIETNVKITNDSISAKAKSIGVNNLSAAAGFLAIPSKATEAALD